MTRQRPAAFAIPASAAESRLADLQKKVEALEEKLRSSPPRPWAGLVQTPGRRVVIGKAGLIQRIELPQAMHRDLEWFTRGRLGAADATFNPSIFRLTDGTVWMLYRCECIPWFRFSKVAIVQLDALMSPRPETNRMLDLPTEFENFNAEDPRFVAQTGNTILVAYNDGIRQSLAVLEVGAWTVKAAHRIDRVAGIRLAEKEKNWTFRLVEAGSPTILSCIYSLEPLMTLEVVVGDSTAAAAHRETFEWKSGWEWGAIRGGSNLFQFGDEQGLLFHSSMKIADAKDGPVRQYFAGLLTLKDGRPSRISREPLMVGEPSEIIERPSGHQVVFPAGAIWSGSSLVVSYGLDDSDSALACWTHDELSASLRPALS